MTSIDTFCSKEGEKEGEKIAETTIKKRRKQKLKKLKELKKLKKSRILIADTMPKEKRKKIESYIINNTHPFLDGHLIIDIFFVTPHRQTPHSTILFITAKQRHKKSL